MARKPNYNFERMERERQKAAKKQERLAARQERNEAKRKGDDEAPPQDTAED